MKILFLAPYPPYPPYGGGTMRIYQLLRGLAARHDVTCLTFSPSEAADQSLVPLQRCCRVIMVRGPHPRGVLRRTWTTLASRLPDMALRNASEAYARALDDLLAQEPFDVVQAESIEMAGYLAQVTNALRVLDQFNAEYVLQQRTALTSLRAALASIVRPSPTTARHLLGGIYSLAQWRKLYAYERHVMRTCNLVCVVSDGDRTILQRLAPQQRFVVAPNGVDTRTFSRAALLREQRGAIQFAAPTLVFSGTLDFRPNIDALVWFAEQVLPRIRVMHPGVRVLAVGRHPAPVLQALAAAGVLTLTGEVRDARPFLAAASVYIVPMRIGGGIRLKVLEALSLEAPVVSTPLGVEGIVGLRDTEHCLLAETPAAFARAVVQLLEQPAHGQQLGAAGRALARNAYDWEGIVPRLEAAYQQ